MPITSLNTFVGTWNTSWTNAQGSNSEMHISANGTATFTKNGGEMIGKLEADGGYRGFWKQTDGAVGEFAFKLDSGGATFKGTYSHTAGGTASGEWVGTKKG
jgi:hypothetical protein